jgi:hypothetical protein
MKAAIAALLEAAMRTDTPAAAAAAAQKPDGGEAGG